MYYKVFEFDNEKKVFEISDLMININYFSNSDIIILAKNLGINTRYSIDLVKLDIVNKIFIEHFSYDKDINGELVSVKEFANMRKRDRVLKLKRENV